MNFCLGLNPDKPCLSQVLREAKEKASVEDDAENTGNVADKRAVIKKVHFETLFDDYQGLVHLEALEMLSKQCDIKLCTIIESMQDGKYHSTWILNFIYALCTTELEK